MLVVAAVVACIAGRYWPRGACMHAVFERGSQSELLGVRSFGDLVCFLLQDLM